MKSKYCVYLLFFGFSLLMSSCNKEEDSSQHKCEFEIILNPVCSFNPKTAQDVQFPVSVLSDGEMLSIPAYGFDWSQNPDFLGSAISVSYSQLPLTVIVTEVDSGCTVEATLDTTFWD